MVMRCEFLKNCKFLDPLSNEQIGKVAGALETFLYDDGEYIIRQGERGDSFYIIEEGTVKCTQIKSSGREIDLITLRAGDYFGKYYIIVILFFFFIPLYTSSSFLTLIFFIF